MNLLCNLFITKMNLSYLTFTAVEQNPIENVVCHYYLNELRTVHAYFPIQSPCQTQTISVLVNYKLISSN